MSGVGTGPVYFFLLALLISILASYTMFNFIGNLKRRGSTFRQFWLAGGAIAFGVGMWVKHFVVVLAYGHVIYISWHSFVGLFFIVFFSLTGFVMLTFHGTVRYPLVLGSVILAFGIAFMTYFSLLGLPFRHLTIHPGLFSLSVGQLFLGTYVSFLLAERQFRAHQWIASIFLGGSVMAVQLIGLEALRADIAMMHTFDHLSREIQLLGAMIGVAALLILLSTWAAWYIDKRFNQMDERYRLLVENSLDMIAILKGDKWGFVNTAGLRMFEASEPKDMLGKSIYAFLPPEDHQAVKERLKNLMFTGGGRPLEQDWYTLKGKVLNTEVVETMTTLDNEPAVQVIIRDISERKKNEELLINSEKLYVAGQLAAGIAHEIRNPLTSLKGFLQLIVSGRKNNETYYDIMNSELDRIEDIVSELLMLSKPQVYQLSHHDVRNMMRETITLLETQAILHNISIHADYGDEPLWVYGVENQIKQVFINVIKNAIEAMIDGGGIQVKLYRIGEEVYVQILDEGPGISEDQLAKMGQPFYTTKEKGTGLGLMVSYKIVDNHRGRINVNSQIGKGTVVEIMLPFRSPDRVPEQQTQSEVAASGT